jgi:hypothetical protein
LWNGNCFLKTSLFDQGFVLWVGHGGLPCPATQRDIGIWEDIALGDDEDISVENTVFEAHHSHDVVVVTDITGVFQHRVAWCTCDGVADKPMQLFREQIFPASYTRVKSAFTFNVLDHFYYDAMECKTAAMSFFQKLRRMTDNAFPHKVQVSTPNIWVNKQRT